MKKFVHWAPLAAALLAGSSSLADDQPASMKLPEPRREGTLSVESALQTRRSIREYRNEPLTLGNVSQLLWAAQGITSPDGRRTAPSAGALYPLEVYLVDGNVTSLSAGTYRYQPRGHAAQSVCLQGVSLDLGAGLIGAFDDDRVKKLLDMPAEQQSLYLVPVGRPR